LKVSTSNSQFLKYTKCPPLFTESPSGTIEYPQLVTLSNGLHIFPMPANELPFGGLPVIQSTNHGSVEREVDPSNDSVDQFNDRTIIFGDHDEWNTARQSPELRSSFGVQKNDSRGPDQRKDTENKNKTEETKQSKPESNRDDNQGTCVVCMVRKSVIVTLPCSHCCMCRECSDDCKKKKGFMCPICRSKITDYLKIIIP
jgi:hypothetical protein